MDIQKEQLLLIKDAISNLNYQQFGRDELKRIKKLIGGAKEFKDSLIINFNHIRNIEEKINILLYIHSPSNSFEQNFEEKVYDEEAVLEELKEIAKNL